MGRAKSRRPRKRLSQARATAPDATRWSRSYRPRLESLEDRIQLGDTVLGLSAVALWGLHFTSLSTPSLREPAERGRWHQGVFSLDAEGSSAWGDARNDVAGTEASTNRSVTAPTTQTNTGLAMPISALDEAPAGRGALVRLPDPTSLFAQTPSGQPALTDANSGASWLGGAVPFSLPALAGNGSPDHSAELFAVAGAASASLAPANLFFDVAKGQLAIRIGAGDHTVHEALADDGFLDVTIDGKHHSSNPSSADFDTILAGASGSSLSAIHVDGAGGHDTLVVDSQNLPHGLRVVAPGAAVITQDVAARGPLVIGAQDLTVKGTLRGEAIALTAGGWGDVEEAGRIEAVRPDAGGRIEVAADVFVNAGQLHADGRSGGQIVVQARNLLNAGPMTADGTSPGGNGGIVHLAFTDSYTGTTAALTSASGAHGGSVVIDGGSAGHLFSSGRHLATGTAHGGTIDLFGRDVVLAAATLDASGGAGGGSIRVGGDLHGRNTAVTNAQTVTVTAATTLRADANGIGDGGRVSVWSERGTTFDGSVSVRGGSGDGQGGFAEVSGKAGLAYAGTADAGASSGKAGTLLLDPKNLVIADAPVGVFPHFDLIDPHPTPGGGFGLYPVLTLSNGNVVVSNIADNFGGSWAGAVYLFDGMSGALLSSLVGNSPNDEVGASTGGRGVIPLSNGNYVIASTYWNSQRGAVTWGSGSTGVSGTISEANSLIGSNPYDHVGDSNSFSLGVTPLTNGNYVVLSSIWNGRRGAVTWANGSTGIKGAVSDANSLVGSHPNDQVGFYIIPLSNGNYVIDSRSWNDNRGAVTWVNGSTGISGTVSEANSLVGSKQGDDLGAGVTGSGLGVTALSNGNYVVASPFWNGARGAVTWADGATGVRGIVSAANSLVGGNANDALGQGGTIPFSNGNYLVESPTWNGGRGAVTWVEGSTGASGTVSEANSLVGSNAGDRVGTGRYGATCILILSNGNYLVSSPNWNGQRGAVTWGSGSTEVVGVVSDSNSLVGSTVNDQIGACDITLLSNGNYLVPNPNWNGQRGAVTWGSAVSGVSGVISAANSLVGTSAGDRVGDGGAGAPSIVLLSNGNYLVPSIYWNDRRGAVTWGSADAGIRGAVSEANSLVGSNPKDQVGYIGFGTASFIIPLSDGNYLITSPLWNGGRGAVTRGDGSTGTSGAVSDSNSLVGNNPNDYVGHVVALNNGNYVVESRNGGRGAVTWVHGPEGFRGTVSETNSLVGSSAGDYVGSVVPLSNGNYVVDSPNWNDKRGAVTWASGSTGISGPVSDANSLVGSNPNDQVGAGPFVNDPGVTPLSKGNYVVLSLYWNGQRGAVTWGNGRTGISGAVSESNSLVGGNPNDQVGFSITSLTNGNYVVDSSIWNGYRGAVTWGNGSTGISGVVSEANSLVGSNPGNSTDYVGSNGITPLSNGNYLVRSERWNSYRGAVTWGNGSTGVRGAVSATNSLVGSNANDGVGDAGFAKPSLIPLSNGNYVVLSPFWNDRRGAVTWVSGTSGQTLDGLGTITPQNSLFGGILFASNLIANPVNQTFMVITPGRITVGFTDPSRLTFTTGQAQSLSITPAFLTRTLNTGTAVVLQASNDIAVNSPITVNASGNGGSLTLQAGRSILLYAPITTDGGALTLIGNDQLANGVVDSQRDAGKAVIRVAPGTALNTGAGALTVALRDGAGLTNRDSGAITLQTVNAGSVSVANNGGDVNLGPVTTSGVQTYANPSGTTTVTGNLIAADSSITFTDSVAVNDGVTIMAGASTVNFAGSGMQTLQSGSGTSFGNINHSGSGTLRLMSGLTVTGTFTNAAGAFDANDQSVTVAGAATVADGTYLAGTAPQTFNVGLSITGGVFTSSTGPMTVTGGITVSGGSLSGVGTVDSVTVTSGTLAPGGNSPGVLTVGGLVALTPSTTLSIVVNGPDAGTGYAQLQAGGPIDLGGSTLRLTFGVEPPVGGSFEILTNTGSAPVAATFNGLDEGALFSQGGYVFLITYQGGSGGNSIVVSRFA